MDDKEVLKELYFEWIKDETFNDTLTGNEAGVKLALELLVEQDPLEFFSDRVVKSESIGGMSQTFETPKNEHGMPIKVMKWISPYYMVRGVF